jgi:hypothetical protein
MLRRSAFELLSRPDTPASAFVDIAPELATIDPTILRRIEVEGMTAYCRVFCAMFRR